MRIDVHDIFPYPSPSTQQAKLIKDIITSYDKYDVHVIMAPVASGKMGIAKAIVELARLKRHTGNIVVPNNALVKQVSDEFPGELATLKRKSLYASEEDFRNAKEIAATFPSVMNTYTVLANKLYKDCAVFDEFHTLLPTLREIAQIRWWDHDNSFPHTPRLITEALQFLSPYDFQPRTQKILEALAAKPGTYTMWYSKEMLRNNAKSCLHYYSLTGRDVAKWLWPPSKTKKLFLLSATAQLTDLYELGLDDRRVKIYEMTSSISPERRPLYITPIGNMSYHKQKESFPKLISYLERALDEKEGKGLIHTTYGISAKIKASTIGRHPRLLFHTNQNKADQFRRWQDSEDGVLIGCGMSEGINLKGDRGRWQIITKVMWPHLGSPVVEAKRHNKGGEEWMAWQAAKEVLQAYGRICRGPNDEGTTFITDSSFIPLYNRYRHLFPSWFTEAVR